MTECKISVIIWYPWISGIFEVTHCCSILAGMSIFFIDKIRFFFNNLQTWIWSTSNCLAVFRSDNLSLWSMAFKALFYSFFWLFVHFQVLFLLLYHFQNVLFYYIWFVSFGYFLLIKWFTVKILSLDLCSL